MAQDYKLSCSIKIWGWSDGYVLFLIVALSVLMNYWWLSIILGLIGLTLLTAYSGTEIDFTNKTFREYHSYLFIRKGVTEKYHGIERVFINRSKRAQKIYTAHTSSSSTFQNTIFNAYLKFDDGRNIFLTSRKNKSRLIQLLHPLVTALSVDLIDNTK